MCGDPDSPVAPHTEDYSEPYLWEMPAEYALCNTCHLRLHRRFKSPFAWEAYTSHVRRGGYGSDLKIPKVARNIAKLAKALRDGESYELEPLKGRARSSGTWWERLTVDPTSLTDPSARLR